MATIESIFNQFGQAIQQGRQQRQQRELAVQTAEQELGAMQRAGVIPDDQAQMGALADMQGIKAGIQFQQQLDQFGSEQAQREANVAGTIAGTEATQQQTAIRRPQAQVAGETVESFSEEFGQFESDLENIRQGNALNGLSAMGLSESEQATVQAGMDRGDSNFTIFQSLKSNRAAQADPKAKAERMKMGLDIATKQVELAQAKADLEAAAGETAKKSAQLKLAKLEGEVRAQTQAFEKNNKAFIDEERAKFNAAIDASQKFDDITDAVDEIIAVVDQQSSFFPATGGRGEVIRALPFSTFTDAGKIGQLVKRVKADAAFTALNDIKKSGATLGQVSNQELALLESQAGTLNPDLSRDDFVKQLNDFRDTRQRALQSVAADLENQGIPLPKALQKALVKQPAVRGGQGSGVIPATFQNIAQVVQDAPAGATIELPDGRRFKKPE